MLISNTARNDKIHEHMYWARGRVGGGTCRAGEISESFRVLFFLFTLKHRNKCKEKKLPGTYCLKHLVLKKNNFELSNKIGSPKKKITCKQ